MINNNLEKEETSTNNLIVNISTEQYKYSEGPSQSSSKKNDVEEVANDISNKLINQDEKIDSKKIVFTSNSEDDSDNYIKSSNTNIDKNSIDNIKSKIILTNVANDNLPAQNETSNTQKSKTFEESLKEYSESNQNINNSFSEKNKDLKKDTNKSLDLDTNEDETSSSLSDGPLKFIKDKD